MACARICGKQSGTQDNNPGLRKSAFCVLSCKKKREADTTITEITAIQRLAVLCPDCGSSSSSPFSSSDSDSSSAPSVVADNFED